MEAVTEAIEVKLPLRRVEKFDTGYQIIEMRIDGWHRVGRPYPHSTSAYAALGRLTQQEALR